MENFQDIKNTFVYEVEKRKQKLENEISTSIYNHIKEFTLETGLVIEHIDIELIYSNVKSINGDIAGVRTQASLKIL